MSSSNKSKSEQLSEISFQFLQNDSLNLESLSGLVEKDVLPEGAILYYKDEEGSFGHGTIKTKGSNRKDLSKDSSFAFFGFDSDNDRIRQTVFYADTCGTSWFVVTEYLFDILLAIYEHAVMDRVLDEISSSESAELYLFLQVFLLVGNIHEGEST